MSRHGNLETIDVSKDVIKLAGYTFRHMGTLNRVKKYQADGHFMTKRNLQVNSQARICKGAGGDLQMFIDFSDVPNNKIKELKDKIKVWFRFASSVLAYDDKYGTVLLYGNTLRQI